ncbi:amino acid adenylation domain-containing protein [Variovorax humicola]|uniref:Amino acid adenylation domain-containing protein n=1 Tax=Variovorax humicola TaxID=1769758 RepID=A0ABU8VRV0_9BURK
MFPTPKCPASTCCFSPPGSRGMHALANMTDYDPFGTVEIERVVATTEGQREIWLASKIEAQASLAYNLSWSLRAEGLFDASVLEAALSDLLVRHEALRSTIGPEGTDLWVATAQPFTLARTDLSALPANEALGALQERRGAAVNQPFDLEKGPLIRAELVTLDAVRSELIMSAHHTICDGWSISLLVRDVLRLYRARVQGRSVTPLPVARYGDFAIWLNEPEAVARRHADEKFWLGMYADTVPALELPLDHPRGAGPRDYASRREDLALGETLSATLRQFSAEQGVSLFSVLFSGFATLMSRLSGAQDLVVGVPLAAQSVEDFAGVVGHCANMLPVRVKIDPAQPANEFARAVGSTILDACEHPLCSFGSLLKPLRIQREAGRLPFVSVVFNMSTNVDDKELSDPALKVHMALNPRQFENFELFCNVTQMGKSLVLECQYSTALFDGGTVRRWLGMLELLLRNAVQTPDVAVGHLGMMSEAELGLLRARQPAATPLQGAPLMHAGFAAQAAAQPARAALRLGSTHLSYAELDAQSNRLARTLRARGVGRGQLVGLCLSRGTEMVIALLAVLKAGAAYVPLDPDFPQARLDYYAQDAALSALLTRSDVDAAPRRWRADAAARVIELDTDPGWQRASDASLGASDMDAQGEDAAYVIYTSGSTGKPKGVAVPHGAVANFLQSMRREPGMTPDDKLLAVTTLSFDIAVLELMLPLTVGAEVIIAPREVSLIGSDLIDLLRESGANVMQATPGTWRLLIDAGWVGQAGFKALVGGESLPPDLARDMCRLTGEVWNMYGPTETTIWSTLHHVDASRIDSGGVSIGKPIDNTTVWILDERLQPVPVGVRGEICIGGKGVALGYLNRPELTAERFVMADVEGQRTRLYRTGDLGRWRGDGLLEHLGRMDFQVKVRGYRIELGEIEARCNETPGVARSVVVTREDRPGDVRLVAYVAMTPGATFDRTVLGGHLRASLPQYMVPQHVVELDALPLLPNGKVDRKALPAPRAKAAKVEPEDAAIAKAGSAEAATAPQPMLLLPEQAQLAQIWASTLGIDVNDIRATDNLFDLGGDSMQAMRIIQQAESMFGFRVEPRRYVFENLGQLATPRPGASADAIQRTQAEQPAKRGLLGRVLNWGRRA